jgi:transposase
MFGRGLGAEVIAASLKVDDQTVRRWRRAFEAGGRDDFHPDRYVRGEQAAAFLHRVPAEYPAGPVDVVWDTCRRTRAPSSRRYWRPTPG